MGREPLVNVNSHEERNEHIQESIKEIPTIMLLDIKKDQVKETGSLSQRFFYVFSSYWKERGSKTRHFYQGTQRRRKKA